MIYNLNLTKDYCSHWTLSMALREIVANTLDHDGTITFTPNVDNDELGTVTFSTVGKLPVEAFLMGYSTKDSDDIGQFGEGLKIGMLRLLTLNQKFSMYSHDEHYLFTFEKAEGMSVPTIHVLTSPRKTSAKIERTKIVVENVERELIESIYIKQPLGVTKKATGLFVKGMFVEYFTIMIGDEVYGINLPAGIKTNRDRDYVSDKSIITPYLIRAFTTEELSRLRTSWYRDNIYRNIMNYSAEIAQDIAKHIAARTSRIPYEELRDVRVLHGSYNTQYQLPTGYMVFYGGDGEHLNTSEDNKMLEEYKIPDEPTKSSPDYTTVVERRFQLLTAALSSESTDEVDYLNNTVKALLKYVTVYDAHRTLLANLVKDKAAALSKNIWTNCKSQTDQEVYLLRTFNADFMTWYYNHSLDIVLREEIAKPMTIVFEYISPDDEAFGYTILFDVVESSATIVMTDTLEKHEETKLGQAIMSDLGTLLTSVSDAMFKII